MKKLLLLSCATVIGLTSHAMAAEKTGFYAGIKAGTAFMSADDISNTTNTAAPAAVNKDSEDNAVFALGASVGYDWTTKGAPVRTELEYAYRHDFSYDANPTFIGAAIPTSTKSEMTSHTVMVNAYYDFKTKTKFTPYLGGGIGVSWNNTDTDGTVIATGVSQNYSETKANFAWNLTAGVGYQLTDAITLDANYRYVDLGKAVWGNPATAELTSDDLTAHEVYLGLRYAF
jgi:opacity protein-like surface antigen